MKSVGTHASLEPKWYTAAKAAQLLGSGETNGWMLIISGDRRSLKDERARRVLPEWVEDYVRLRASRAEDAWEGRRLDVRAVKDRSLSIPMGYDPMCGLPRAAAVASASTSPASAQRQGEHRPSNRESDRGRVDEPNAIRTQRTAASPRWGHCQEPPLLDRPPCKAGAGRRPLQLHSPRRDPGHPATSSGRRERSETLAPAGSQLWHRAAFAPTAGLLSTAGPTHLWKWTRYGSPSHSGPGRRTVECGTPLLRSPTHRQASNRVRPRGSARPNAESALARFVEAGSVPVMTVPGGHRA